MQPLSLLPPPFASEPPPLPPTRLARRTRRSPHVTHTTRAVALTRGLCPQGGVALKGGPKPGPRDRADPPEGALHTGRAVLGSRCPLASSAHRRPVCSRGRALYATLGRHLRPPRESLCTPVQAHPPNRRAPPPPPGAPAVPSAASLQSTCMRQRGREVSEGAGGGGKGGGVWHKASELERGGGVLGPEGLCTKKWPNQIFPMSNFVVSRDGHFGPERAGAGGGGSRAMMATDTELTYTPPGTGIWSPPRLSLCSVLPWGVQGGRGHGPPPVVYRQSNASLHRAFPVNHLPMCRLHTWNPMKLERTVHKGGLPAPRAERSAVEQPTGKRPFRASIPTYCPHSGAEMTVAGSLSPF